VDGEPVTGAYDAQTTTAGQSTVLRFILSSERLHESLRSPSLAPMEQAGPRDSRTQTSAENAHGNANHTTSREILGRCV